LERWAASASAVSPGGALDSGDLVSRGQLDPRDALALVAWPSMTVVAASVAAVAAGRTRKRRSEAQRLRALELVDEGWSWAAAGREVGAPKQTVGTWVRKRRLTA